MKPELDQIIHLAGRDAFAEACQIARRTAPGFGKSGRDPAPTPDFVYDISSWIIDDLRLAPLDAVALLFAIYERMPSYALLIASPAQYADDSPAALALFQSKCREMLGADDDALADPIGYWLWCGPFEDGKEVVESWWHVLTSDEGPPRLFERLLEISGPVPWPLKAELYERLFPDQRWHPFIRRSLEASQGDLYGNYDIEAATEWYDRLGWLPEPDSAPSL